MAILRSRSPQVYTILGGQNFQPHYFYNYYTFLNFFLALNDFLKLEIPSRDMITCLVCMEFWLKFAHFWFSTPSIHFLCLAKVEEIMNFESIFVSYST